MRVPLTWLSEYVAPPPEYSGEDCGWDAEALVERLVMTGTEVEAVHRIGVRDPDGFVVGVVEEAGRHPDADRLSVCRVLTGDPEARTIVCGAPNVAAGQTVAVALPGATLPDGRRLDRAKLRGVESDGMILSAAELEIGEDAGGIMVLPSGAEPGTPLGRALAIADTVIELEVTPNRPDCLGIYGVAREVSAITGAELVSAPWSHDVSFESNAGKVDQVASVEVEVPELCPRFTARAFTDVAVGPSPPWLQARLVAAGQRPINNVVDITNYVMLLTSQPLHAFDLDRVPGGELTIRKARAGERVETLDGVDRGLPEGTVVVCDRDGPAAIAGVMGGASSEVGEGTNAVLLEVANWNGPDILRASRRLALRSEASARFEKQLHPALCERAQRIASRLMVEICGAKPALGTIDVAAPAPSQARVALSTDRTDAVLGMAISPHDQRQILERLGCGPIEEVSIDQVVPPNVDLPEVEAHEAGEHQPVLWATIPPDRHYDLTREADLIEEVGRVYGLENLPVTLPSPVGGTEESAVAGGLSRYQELRRVVEDELCALGFNEIVGWSFTGPDVLEKLKLAGEVSFEGGPGLPVGISNPISAEQAVMRSTLLGSLLDAAAYNSSRDAERIALFESGRVYEADRSAPSDPSDPPASAAPLRGEFPGGRSAPAQETHRLAALAVGPLGPPGWDGSPAADGFYAMKGVLEALATRLGVSLAFSAGARPFLHPGRSAEITLEGAGGAKSIGWIGELHPLVVREWDLPDATAFELDLASPVARSSVGLEMFEDVTGYPPVIQDLAAVVPEEVTADRLRTVILEAGKPLLVRAEVFDLFRGEQLGADRKSLAMRLEFRADDRTLTDDEVGEVRAELESAVESIGGSIRA